MSAPTGAGDRERALAIVRRQGRNSTSSQVLEPDFRYMFVDDDAGVAYVDTGHAWVAAGAPLADEDRMREVIAAFVDAAGAAGRRACFFGTDERFAALGLLQSLPVGEQAAWDPAHWDDALRGSRSLREQLRRAGAKGVRVRAVDLDQTGVWGRPLRSAVRRLVDRWLCARELAPMGFLATVQPLASVPDRRLLIAERKGDLIGLALIAPVSGPHGWLVQNLLRDPDAPNGTAEALIDHAMRMAASEGLKLVTLGLAPLAGNVCLPLRIARFVGAPLFNFEGLRAFKAKLQPMRWDRIYLSFPHGTPPMRSVLDVLAAFAHGRLLRFALLTLLRAPAIVVTLLAVLLVPWTALLAAADSCRWFPYVVMKWVWFGFDILLMIGLFTLHARWRDGLARLVTYLVGADAILTAVQSACWNAPRAHETGEKLVLVVATLAPVLAYAVLARASARRCRI